jgi:hypothetical protein
MKIATAAAGALAALVIMTIIKPEPTVVYQTEVIERVHVEEVLTTLDIEELKDQIGELDQALYDECVAIIVHRTGDPEAGVIRHIERHYDGDACQAADEALRGDW